MRILFIHEVNYLLKPIYEMHELPEILARRNHEVGFIHFPEFSQNGFYERELGPDVVSGRVLPDVEISLFSTGRLGRGLFSRLAAALMARRFVRRTLRRFEPDIVVSFAVPTLGWQALLECRASGIPFVYRALDVSHKIRKTKFSGLIHIAERFICRNSTWVTCNNEALRQYCIALGASRDTTSVELPPLNLDHFRLAHPKREEIRARLGISDQATVILYMGSFFYFSGLDQVLRQLSKEPHKPTLVLVGGGEQEAELRELVGRLNLEDYALFTGYVGYDKLPEYLSIADVAINPMLPSLVSNAALPNKVLQYMAAGLPVVSTALSGLTHLFPKTEGLGIVESPDDVLKRAIAMASSPDLSKLGLSNRHLIEETFSREKSADSLENLLDRVWGSK